MCVSPAIKPLTRLFSFPQEDWSEAMEHSELLRDNYYEKKGHYKVAVDEEAGEAVLHDGEAEKTVTSPKVLSPKEKKGKK